MSFLQKMLGTVGKEPNRIAKNRMIKVGSFLYYDPKSTLGKGSNGTIVVKGIHLALDGDEQVAIKRVLRSEINESSVQHEVELMLEAISHPNILRYIYTEMSNDFLFIATELCIGTLQDFYFNAAAIEHFDELRSFLTEWEVLHQVTTGLHHLHSLGIVHRDIKPSNILIFIEEVEDKTQPAASYRYSMRMKLADFGIAKILKTDKDDFTNTSVTNPNGTRGWMAPEVYESNRFDFKVDVWALGCIFGYTLSRGHKHPFGDDLTTRIDRIIRKQPMVMANEDLQEAYSRDGVACKLIQSMLEIEPFKRPTVGDILNKNTLFLFNMDKTHKLLDICRSFQQMFLIPDNIVAHFKQLVNDPTVDIHAVAEYGWVPLHFVCQYYSNDDLIDILRLMIQKRAYINVKTDDGHTPLHLFYFNPLNMKSNSNNHDVVGFLIEKGADVNARTNAGLTPLDCYFNCYPEKFGLGPIIT